MIMRFNNDNRITIPHKIREKLGLEPGQEFDVEITEDGKNIIINPIEQLRVCPKCYNIMRGNVCEYCKAHKEVKK